MIRYFPHPDLDATVLSRLTLLIYEVYSLTALGDYAECSDNSPIPACVKKHI
jgi:hypothetical protein